MSSQPEKHPVHELIHEESAARGWSEHQFIARFCMYNPAPTRQAYFIAECWWHASDIEGLLMDDDSANTLHRIFGPSAEFWKNYHAAYQNSIAQSND